MFNLHLTRSGHREGVHLGFPASPGEVGEAFAWLDSISTDAADTKILDVACTVGNLKKHIINTDFSAPDTIGKLNRLAEKLDGMGAQEQQIFSGARTRSRNWIPTERRSLPPTFRQATDSAF